MTSLPTSSQDFLDSKNSLEYNLSALEHQMLQLLQRGLPPTTVAHACGVTPSAVSQFLEQEHIASIVSTARAALTAKFLDHDEKIDDLESRALDRVAKLLPIITKPMEAMKTAAMLNSMKRRASTASSGTDNTPAIVVELNLPAASAISIKVSSQNQVVEVEGRSMATLPSSVLAARMQQASAQRTEQMKTDKLLQNCAQSPTTLIDLL